MSSFWKFVGGLLVGAAAAHLVNEEYKKRKQGPPPVRREEPNKEVKPTMNDKVHSEKNMVEDLIRTYENKKNKTRRDQDTLDLLRIKLRQIQNN
jgi:hypothetical protein